MARKLVLRQIRELKSMRSLSTTVFCCKNDEFVIKSSLQDIVMPNARFLDRLWQDSSHFENQVALECAETKKSYTYTNLQKNMAVFATSLRKKLGLKENDIVSAMLPNSPEFAVVAFGTLQAGCIFSPAVVLNPINIEFEISHQLSTINPKVIVTISEYYDVVLKRLKNDNSQAKIVLIDNINKPMPDGTIKYSEIAESGEADYALLDKVEKQNEDVAFIPFSSGTTGLPKGVEISYKNLKAAIEIMQRKRNCFPILAQGNTQDIVPCILPFSHIYGLVITLVGHLTRGCKLVTIPRFSATVYLDMFKNQKPTLLYVVPPIAILLGKHPDIKEEHFRHVRHITCGAAPLAASDVQAILKKSKRDLQFHQGYAATETSSLATLTLKETKERDYSACGVPLASVTMKLVDPLTGKAVPFGQPGEVYIKAPTVMKGYHKNEKETKESLTEDGYFKTGDLGYYKPDQGLYITDRIKELIKVKDMQVSPAELESILKLHPAVQDVAVVGIPHQFYGEVPKAFIIKKNGQKATPEELQTFVASKVASFKKIKEVVFVSDIPKTNAGKILRKDLRKMYG